MIRGMAVSDIPAEKILNARTSYAELLYYIPERDRYRWDADHTYMAAMGYPAVDGQVLPPVNLPPFPLNQLTYLDSRYQLIGQPVTPRSRRVVVTGDSIDQHRDQNGAKPYFGGSLWSYLGLWSKQRFNLARNVAVGGRTTAQMLAGFQSEVVAYNPGIVVIGGGRNDLNGGVPTATTRANISQMVALARQNGIEPVLHTLAPVDIAGGGAFNSIEKNRQGTIAHNVWLKKLATDLNVAVIDLWSLWADKKTGAWLPTLSTDGVHPTDTAIFVAVRSLVGYMPAIFAGRAPLPTDNFYPGNLLGNALATTDNNVDGLPDGWYFPAPAKISLVDADYGKRVVILAGDYTPAYSAGFPAEKAMDPAKTYALTGVVSHDRGVQATIQVVDQSYQNVATAIVSNEGPLVDGVFYVEFTGNAAIKNLFVLTQVNGPGGSASISRLSVSEVSISSGAALTQQQRDSLARGEDVWNRYKPQAQDLGAGYDLNTILISGQYRGPSAVNAPVAMNGEWLFLEVIAYGDGYVYQRATEFTGGSRGRTWQRLRANYRWEPWSRTDISASEHAHNPADATMSRWFSALKKVSSRTGHAKLLFVGDSTTAGVGAANITESFVSQLMGRLSLGSNVQEGASIVGTRDFDARWTLGSWQTVFGPGSGALYAETNATTSATFTPNSPVDTIDVWWYKGIGKGKINYKIDGAAQAQIDTNSTDGSGGWKKTTITVPLGTHIVSLDAPTTNPVHVFVDAFNDAHKSIRVSNWGVSGSTANQWTETPYSLDGISDYNADLVVIMLGINDAGQNVSVADWKTRIERIISSARANGGNVILATPIVSNENVEATRFLREQEYMEQAGEIASRLGIPYINMFTSLGAYKSSLFADNLHPNAKGYSRVAKVMFASIQSL